MKRFAGILVTIIFVVVLSTSPFLPFNELVILGITSTNIKPIITTTASTSISVKPFFILYQLIKELLKYLFTIVTPNLLYQYFTIKIIIYISKIFNTNIIIFFLFSLYHHIHPFLYSLNDKDIVVVQIFLFH